VADGPRGVVPDPPHGGAPVRRQPLAAPGETGGGLSPDRAAGHKPPPPLFGRRGALASHPAIAGQRLRLGSSLGPRLVPHAHGRHGRRPGLHRGRRQPTPPALLLPAHGPGWMGRGAGSEPGAPLFFRTDAGSGRVIPGLARGPRPPRAARARRLLAPLRGRCVRPSAYAGVAASAHVPWLGGGQRCAASGAIRRVTARGAGHRRRHAGSAAAQRTGAGGRPGRGY
jgi:hypothetical protein